MPKRPSNRSVCDDYDFRPKYGYEHTLGQHILTFTNTNLFGMKFFGKYNYEYIWIKFLKQKQIQLYSCLLKWANMNMNTIIQTDIWDYEYK